MLSLRMLTSYHHSWKSSYELHVQSNDDHAVHTIVIYARLTTHGVVPNLLSLVSLAKWYPF